MRIDDESGVIWIRQSWLSDYLHLCQERTRLKMVHPTWDGGSDATSIGTAVHAYLERRLDGADPDEAITAAMVVFGDCLFKNPKMVKFTPLECEEHIYGCAEAWENDIRLHVQSGGEIEHHFQLPTTTRIGGYTLGLEGTIDYATARTVWDWKTSTSPYRQHEKQAYNIQASIYSWAAVQLGITSWPVDFRFGVMVRGKTSADPAKGQIVQVRRTAEHGEWAIRQAAAAARSVLALGLDNEWPMNDDNFLCSEKWCPFWLVCKGAHLSTASHRWKP